MAHASIALAICDGFVGLTAAIGAVFVIPTLPNDLYRFHYLYGETLPTVGLGLVAAICLGALFALLTGKKLGAALSITAGAALVVFELVESFAVGSPLTPPVGLGVSGHVALWLQPFYIAVGLGMVVLGGLSPAGFANRPLTRFDVVTGRASRTAAIALVVLTVGFGGFYGWAATSTGTSMYAREFAWGDGTTYDWSRFPSRALPAAATPYRFPEALQPYDLRAATDSANPDQFFISNDSTALLVIQHDRLVLERYFNGTDRSTMITSFSNTKSWNSAMVGAAIAAGYIHTVDDPVTAYIPELSRKDPRFASVTIRELLQQRSGIGLNKSGLLDNDDAVLYNTTALRQAVLDRVRIVDTPGTVFYYNDFNPLLIGIVLERATRRSVTEWLEKTLWDPLGPQYPGSFSIDSLSGGFEKMPSGLNATPIDLMRLGVLYLHGGSWNGVQLVPSEWVAESVDSAKASPSMMYSTSLSYGMGWWTQRIDGIEVYYTWGNHGEYVMVVPSLDIVIGRFGRQYGLGAAMGDQGGGIAGHVMWPQILTRIATTVAGT
ncbi:MAG TPA: serine hydrolase [Candidatus Dormibacteraeota bacterium]